MHKTHCLPVFIKCAIITNFYESSIKASVYHELFVDISPLCGAHVLLATTQHQ